MTRLSEALRRAAEETAGRAVTVTGPPAGELAADSTWQFAPVETMHVPVEPAVPSAFAPPELRRIEPPAAPVESGETSAFAPAPPEEVRPIESSSPAGSAVAASGSQVGPLRFGDADRNKLIVGEGVDPAM